MAEWANAVHKVNINIHEMENILEVILQSRKGQIKCGGVKVKVFHFGSQSTPE